MANTHQASGSRSIIDELNALRERHLSTARPQHNAINELHQALAELESRLGDLQQPALHSRDIGLGKNRHTPNLAEVAEQLRQYTNRHDRAEGIVEDVRMLQTMDERLDELNRSSYVASRQQSSDPEHKNRLDLIENKLTNITRQLDNSAAEQNADVFFRRLGELSERLDALGEASELPKKAVEQLVSQVNLLAHQIGRVMEKVGKPDYRDLERLLNAIEKRLDVSERQVKISSRTFQEQIDNKFKDLTKRLDAQYTSHYADGGMLRTIEGRLDEISQQISINMLKTPQVEEIAFAESEAIRGLERQIANIARQLAKPSLELADIKPRLDVIEQAVSVSRESILEAAREAAEIAVERVSRHGLPHDSEIAVQLANDMKSLAELAHTSDERNSKTFKAIHETLSKVVDRLANLEQQVTASPALSKIEEQLEPTKNPYSIVPQRFPTLDVPKTHEALSKLPIKETRVSAPTNSFQSDNVAELDLNTIMKRVREERTLHEAEASETKAKADLISIARRAAQQAAEESTNLERSTENKTTKKNGAIGDIFNRQRKAILMAVGAVMLAIAGLQVGATFLGASDPNALSAKTETSDIDKSITGSIAPQRAQSIDAQEQSLPKPSETIANPAPPHKQTNIEQSSTQPLEGEASDSSPAAEPDHQAVSVDVPLQIVPEALRAAAISGDAHALFAIGMLYSEGHGVTEDLTEAAKWFKLSAEKNYAVAQYRLGNMNEKGIGMPRNLEQAIGWYQKSATQGNANAMHNLAVLFASGANSTPDNASAVRWFTQAAELGVKDSQYNLGILAAKGLGMQVDLEESYKWFALAAKAGDKDAADKRDQIGATLQPQQLERAKGTVELWKAKTLNQEANSFELPEEWSDQKPVAAAPADMKKAVRNIQLILKKNGYDVGSADGVMGNKTRNAIAEIQKANGQEPTGEVNQQLVELLLEKNK
ncbi:SEL1-like repeat protein [Ochrobactrum sp. Marseille-Q0166]|uniref:SEL1-like repeat protein n=1 Tax=Ochrobactrum sp. Marseille-Q0166 TaxID=2761105 RepID=UPI0016563F51|nr:SEL1-like repeat protein [Ochrobactrum sp. Marseille-Q0166]MBC8718725.1 SEL1-like repeat protein [Ochrobactrum sp. Marseille-Q0166]